MRIAAVAVAVAVATGAVAVVAAVVVAAASLLRIPIDKVVVREHSQFLLERGAALLRRHVLRDLVES